MALDPEAVLIAYLRDSEDVALITEEVLGDTPTNISEPWVRVTMFDEASTHGRAVRHLLEVQFQIDCYAGKRGGQELASDLSAAIVDAIEAMPEATFEDAVVTATQSRRRRNDDSSFKPPMHCYAVTATVWIHP